MSQTYRRSQKPQSVDPDVFVTYRVAVALRILHRAKGRISRIDAWQLAAIPAWFMWAFRKPRAYFKKKSMDRKIKRHIAKSNSGQNNPQ